MRTRRLIVAGQSWRVTWCKSPRIAGQYVFGYCDPASQRIYVSSKLAPDAQRITLLHELIHSFHSANSDHHPHDEDQCVNVIASALHQVVREPENKWLLPYLLEA